VPPVALANHFSVPPVPVAVNEAVPFPQGTVFTTALGAGGGVATFTVTDAVTVQPLLGSIVVTVYVVVTIGVAMGVAHDVQLKPAEGAHE
jgi:hypothetical protein